MYGMASRRVKVLCDVLGERDLSPAPASLPSPGMICTARRYLKPPLRKTCLVRDGPVRKPSRVPESLSVQPWSCPCGCQSCPQRDFHLTWQKKKRRVPNSFGLAHRGEPAAAATSTSFPKTCSAASTHECLRRRETFCRVTAPFSSAAEASGSVWAVAGTWLLPASEKGGPGCRLLPRNWGGTGNGRPRSPSPGEKAVRLPGKFYFSPFFLSHPL